MLKSIIFGIVWCFVVYLGTCILVGSVAGGIAGAADPENAAVVGAQAGEAAVLAYRSMFLIGAIIFACLGTWLQFLPGTKRSNARSGADT